MAKRLTLSVPIPWISISNSWLITLTVVLWLGIGSYYIGFVNGRSILNEHLNNAIANHPKLQQEQVQLADGTTAGLAKTWSLTRDISIGLTDLEMEINQRLHDLETEMLVKLTDVNQRISNHES